MKMSQSTSMIASHIEKFRRAFQQGLEGFVEAAEIYVEAIDQNPLAADEFREQFADSIPATAWAQLEAVGRKWMHPKLLMGGLSDRRRACHIKRLPYSLQERVFNRDRFPLLVGNGEHISVDMLEATTEQVDQLCAKGTIRTLPEQKAWLESRRFAKTEQPERLPYVIKGNKVSFRRGVTMTKKEIRRLLEEM